MFDRQPQIKRATHPIIYTCVYIYIRIYIYIHIVYHYIFTNILYLHYIYNYIYTDHIWPHDTTCTLSNDAIVRWTQLRRNQAFSLDVMVGKPCMENSAQVLWHLATSYDRVMTNYESFGQSPAWLLSVRPLTGSPPAPDSRISNWNQKLIRSPTAKFCKGQLRSRSSPSLDDLAPGVMLLGFIELCLQPSEQQEINTIKVCSSSENL